GPAVSERRRPAEVVARFGADADGVGRKPLEEDERRDDEQAEAEQPPMRRRPPEATAKAGVLLPRGERAHQGVFAIARPRPGVVVVVVVTVVVVVVLRRSRPGGECRCTV